MNVVYAGTRNLYPAMKGAIRSLLEHNPDAKVYILAEDDAVPFDLPCTVINVSGQTYFPPDNPNMKSQFTYMAMIRICTPELIPEDRVIQLDVDTIVCDSLEPIWNIDMTGKWVAWCEEKYGRWKPFGDPYYNFGVAVLNLKQMRESNGVKLMVHELNCNQFPFIDQDVMNLYAVPDRCIDLPSRYNESFCCGYSEHPAIVHYAGYPDWYTNSGSMPRWWYRDKYKDGEE